MTSVGARDVRFTLKNVRFAPESGHVQCNSGCPLCANSGHCCGYLTNSISLGRHAFVKNGSSGL